MPGAVHPDPLAGLSWGDIDVEITAGNLSRTVTVPGSPALPWLLLLLRDADSFSFLDVIPGMLTDAESVAWVNSVILTGKLPPEELEETVWDVVEIVSGRPWWNTALLLGIARAQWGLVHGQLVRDGVDPASVSLGAYLNAAESVVWPHLAEEGRQALSSPPPMLAEPVDEKITEENFLAMMNTLPR